MIPQYLEKEASKSSKDSFSKERELNNNFLSLSRKEIQEDKEEYDFPKNGNIIIYYY